MAPDAQRYSSLTTHHSSLSFAIASRDELWLNGVRVESRLSHGVARDFSSRINASDDFDEELVHACDELIARLRRSVVDGARMRLVAGARRVREVVMTEATITTTIGGVSIVGSDVDALRTILATPRRDEWREQIAASIAGAIGEPIHYPGVICSREGQELAVGSFAPVMVTR